MAPRGRGRRGAAPQEPSQVPVAPEAGAGLPASPEVAAGPAMVASAGLPAGPGLLTSPEVPVGPAVAASPAPEVPDGKVLPEAARPKRAAPKASPRRPKSDARAPEVDAEAHAEADAEAAPTAATRTGSKAAPKAAAAAAPRTGSKAGSRTGSKAAPKTGSKAGEKAASKAGEKAASKAGDNGEAKAHPQAAEANGAEAKATRRRAGGGKQAPTDRTRIVFLGGIGEIGRNMTLFEHDGKILIVDTGLMFPTEEMLGVDLVLPDFAYVRERKKQVVGMVLTHAHEDHIGGIPYLLRDVNPPIYGTKLTLGLLKGKLDEHRLSDSARLREIKPGGRLTIGPFRLRFLQVAHSIPGCVAIVISTSAGSILHTGDWKLDPTPVDGKPTDIAGFAEVGREGIDLLLSDSTNALVPGHLPSERSAGEAVRDVVRRARGRIVIACFASNIHRIQQILAAAHESGRMVAFIGRSMVRNVQIASELGYLDVPEGVLVSIDEAGRHPGHKVVIVCTGSQGEPLAALSLMAVREHRHIDLTEADTVVFSATPIPGNESAVRRVIEGLSRIGVEVVAPPAAAVHVSGHAAAGELRTMLSLVQPKWFIPIHGEFRMLKEHARIAQEVGVPADRTMLVEDGEVVEVGKGRVRKLEKIDAGYVFVDGLGIGDVEDVVLRDRRLLAGDGILVCVLTVDRQTGEMLAGPDLISRGFVYEGQAMPFYEEARAALRASLENVAREELADWATLRRHVRRSLGKFVWSRTGRRPIILPVVMEV